MRTLIIVFLLGTLSCHHKSDPQGSLEGMPLPSIDLQLTDSITHVNTVTLFSGKTTVLLLFEPDCPFCKTQTETIVSHIHGLRNIQFCLITDATLNEVRSYIKEFELQRYPNITVAIDTTYQFMKYFKAYATPSLAVFSADKKLKKVVVGLADADEIKNIAFQ